METAINVGNNRLAAPALLVSSIDLSLVAACGSGIISVAWSLGISAIPVLNGGLYPCSASWGKSPLRLVPEAFGMAFWTSFPRPSLRNYNNLDMEESVSDQFLPE
ncbi:hypothetical protein F2Q69_00007460 [Brassica cretica]|uniref:Uncharacterized protein n=1 Tax=Brassica cretica TaxID=69181 RepID=A0A8S9PGD2_BRACR|nr:hypothetical protein F2Q69_00007460 [Brassica cretica]